LKNFFLTNFSNNKQIQKEIFKITFKK